MITGINIKSINPAESLSGSSGSTTVEKGLFAKQLAQQLEIFATSAISESLSADGNMSEGQSDGMEDDIEAIKSQGLHEYIKNLEEEQMKELREEILQSMGLSEEKLNDMSVEQRAAVEKVIARKIQERLNAKSEMENDGDGAGLDQSSGFSTLSSLIEGKGSARKGLPEITGFNPLAVEESSEDGDSRGNTLKNRKR